MKHLWDELVGAFFEMLVDGFNGFISFLREMTE